VKVVVHLRGDLQVDECGEVGQKNMFLILIVFKILKFFAKTFKNEEFTQEAVF